ncbi:sulfurtransferase [Tsuneonella suprasediminis]|uniref:Sulfurtransferase n=1 Tax=Tsuneonella suprasediminis TaxID=2306996 RepID=A0A419QYY9_9SPHN|nr:sulfurtransferase [Tsuneonella suprasediminis]RJX66027.1 sulfurtransferase [Tsuneonella suprasediminis]
MDSLVSTDWLAHELGAGDLVILDASAHIPATGRDAAAEFAAEHIPGARFLDLRSLTNPASPTLSAVPSAEQFAERMGALGIQPGSRIVLYDDSSAKTACRAWFIMHMNGTANVAILDGGMPKWRCEGRPLESGAVSPVSCDYPIPVQTPEKVRSKAHMLANCASHAEQVIDARDAGRFTAQTIDTVHNLPGGHIPGARNLCYAELYNEDGTLRDDDELRARFINAGVDLDAPIITSCGSGVTASSLLFALDRLGKTDFALYDGSWSEWGADPATPKETGYAA